MGVSNWLLAVVTLVALCTSAALGGQRSKPHYDPARAGEYFEQFVADHGRQYGSEQEKQRRLAIFKQNLAAINERNQRDEAVYGITKFADVEVHENHQSYSEYSRNTVEICNSFDMSTIQNVSSDDSWDWRTKKAVTAVKDEIICKTSWAFSTMGNIEGQLAIKHKKLISLSVQELMECDLINKNCYGGSMLRAFRALQNIGGVMSDADYPYNSLQTNACQFKPKLSQVTVTGCTSFLKGLTEEKLKVILKQTGPLAVAVNGMALMLYEGGVMTECNGSLTNHGALLVGYGKDSSGTPYWIVKSSWGTNWGEGGYYRVKMGINGCGMLNTIVATAVIK